MNKWLALGLLATMTWAIGSTPAQAVDKAAIDQAVEKGVQALRTLQRPDGTWPYSEIGATALAGLALLECGVKEDDKAVQHAANAVRKASPKLTQTYSITLSILFLDRLGDPDDVPLLEALIVRVLAGQDPGSGGWSYTCPSSSPAETRRLEATINKRKEEEGSRELRKPLTKRKFEDLSPEIQKQLHALERGEPLAPPAVPGFPQANPPGAVRVAPGLAGDNSNTQFASLALWVGRRYGVPINDALTRLDRRFRTMQMEDGGWTYMPRWQPAGMPNIGNPLGTNSTATMTCAGLLALAITDGATLELSQEEKTKRPKLDLNKDIKLRRGLEALGNVIGSPRGIEGYGPGGVGVKPPPGRVGGRTYYFLWSLERVAVALDLDTIGKKDWYNWGAEILLDNQSPNGTWRGDYADSGADTCFALLFLKRANLARDLTAQIKGKVKDPGERVLRGTVGFNKLSGRKIQSGIETNDSKPLEKPLSPTLDTESGQLADQLLKENGDRQNDLLEKMESAKGVQYTEALAAAIPRLEGGAQRKAREALANRLTRMKDETLAEYLQDEDAEIRRGAALAVGQKESKALVPNLIELLRDPQLSVVRAAHASLKALTEQDFGPAVKATREERDQAMLKWAEWWSKQGKKSSKE
jgi:hypothetical protein